MSKYLENREYPHLNLQKSMALYEESLKLSPGGMMGIRRPYKFVIG